MKPEILLPLLKSWAATQTCRVATDLLSGPPPTFEIPGLPSATSRGLLVGVYPEPTNQEVVLGLWLPETGDGLWTTITEAEPDASELYRFTSCATPEAAVAELDRLAREFLAQLKADRE